MTEAGLQRAVTGLCGWLGLRWYHTHDSRRSVPGFPDLVVVGRAVLWRELKSTTGRLTPAQRDWLAALSAAGADAGTWRPADLASGRILAELRQIR